MCTVLLVDTANKRHDVVDMV